VDPELVEPELLVLEPVLVEELLVPPSGGGTHGPHTPSALPTATMHVSPGQQSALTVHLPQFCTQPPGPLKQMYGGVPPGLGTQGRSLQQFALDAHEPPGMTHVRAAQRGTPRLSCLHVSSFSQLPLQQSHEALHDIVASLQTSPSGLQPMGLVQMPTALGAVMSHVTGLPEPPGSPALPQQSVSCVQRSPTTWQPLAGWQTRTSVGP
jgi:hypothetical protein